MAQCVVRALMSRACHSGLLSCIALQTALSAYVAFASRMRLHPAFSHTQRLITINIIFSPMSPSLRFPTVAVMMHEVCKVLHSEAPTVDYTTFVCMCIYVAAALKPEVAKHELYVSAVMRAAADTSMRQRIFLLI